MTRITYLVVLSVLFSLFPFTRPSAAQDQTAFTFAAVADTRALESNPTTNYGALSRLDVDNPGQESYIHTVRLETTLPTTFTDSGSGLCVTS